MRSVGVSDNEERIVFRIPGVEGDVVLHDGCVDFLKVILVGL